jgi:hypothetical protein
MIEVILRQRPFVDYSNMEVMELICKRKQYHQIPETAHPVFQEVIAVN